jgi:hypothetical protein
MTQVIYMDEDPPFALRPDRCEHLAPLLRQCVAAAAQWADRASGRFDPRITRWQRSKCTAKADLEASARPILQPFS